MGKDKNVEMSDVSKEKNTIEIENTELKDDKSKKNIEMNDVSKEKNATEIENNELKDYKSNKIAKPIIKESEKNINNFLVNAMNDISDLEIKKGKNATENIEIIKPTIKDKNIEMSDVSKEKNAIEIENNELKNDKSNKIAKPIIKESEKNINN